MCRIQDYQNYLKIACKDTKNISRAQINMKKSEKKLLFLAYVNYLL